MRNSTENSTIRRNSKVVARLRRNRKLISPRQFKNLYQGKIKSYVTAGIFYCGFNSQTQNSHGWGDSFSKAYRNMLRNFHHKYAA